MRKLAADSLVARWLSTLARLLSRHPRWFFYPQVGLFCICVAYTVAFLEFDTNRNHLVGANKKYHQNFLRFQQEFPKQDDLVVVVESDQAEKNRQFVERLGAKLEAETGLFQDVFYKGDLKMMGPKALQLVPEGDLHALLETLTETRPFIEQFTQATNLASLFQLINAQFRAARRDTTPETDALVKALPALNRIVTQATASLQRPGTPPSPGIAALFDASDRAEQESYLTFAKGQIYLVTAYARSEALNPAAVQRLRELVEETRAEVPGLNVGVTGEPVLELDEMRQSQKDTTVASLVALGLCALIFIYGYQETGRPIKAVLCLVVGLAYTLAFATLVVGHLNILTITFVPILIGLAIDFGVHLVTRYEEELRQGRAPEEALTCALVFTGRGIFTGAFTTAGGFLAMGFTQFKGIQEMGIICGGGLLVCLVPMLTLLPVLLLRGRQNVQDHDRARPPDTRAQLEQVWLRRPRRVTALALGLCVLAAFQARKIYFDYNLLNMQSAGLPAVVFEKKLIGSADKSVLFGAVIADSLEQAVAWGERIRQLPAVAGVESLSHFLQEDHRSKLAVISRIKDQIRSLAFAPPDAAPVDLPQLSRALWTLSGYLGLALDELPANDAPELRGQLLSLREAISELRRQMLHGPPEIVAGHAAQLAAFQQALFVDLRETFAALQTQDDRTPLQVADLPSAWRDRFVGVTHKYLLQVFPRQDVWQRGYQKEFIDQLRTVDPNVTGTPVQLYEYTSLLKDSYEEAAWYSLGAIAVLVFLHFRSLVAVVLALLPVAVGSLWLVGLMGWRGVPFNPANIMTLPLVIGIGVTNGIHILNRFAEERSPGILAKSTGKAVLVSGLTTIAGFGSLMLADHRGIASLGFVMATGVAACMIAALGFLPALMHLLQRAVPAHKKPSADNAPPSTLGREEPR
ncbi:MAG: MMPL family transporter [Verrucomicrobia bacterium]|nr:MMPL family transporter [Verrucomicrobiota bacterium]